MTEKEYNHETDAEVPEGTDLVVTSMPHDRFYEETKESLRIAVEEGEPQDHYQNFEDPKKIQKLLSPTRLELLVVLLEDEFDSISALARAVDRDYKDVYEDVETLAEYGIVRFDEDSNGRGKKPYVPYENVRVEVEVGKATADH